MDATMTPPPNGLFITLEGIDGSGKSTQAQLLAEGLRAIGYDVVRTREPGGSPGAEEIRSLVLEGPPDRWSPESELLLFTAARRDHLEKTIRPALAKGQVVICDRFADSTRIYQGITRADLRRAVDVLHDLMIGQEPDLTYVIDIAPEQGLARAQARQAGEQRFEDFGLAMQAQMRDGFLALAAEFSERCHVIDGNRPPAQVAADLLRIARAHLSGLGPSAHADRAKGPA